jgi:uncharacterized SAM-binding protein YcdF (DUF218 family)
MDAPGMDNSAFIKQWPRPIVRLAGALRILSRLFLLGMVTFVVGLVLFAHLIEDVPRADIPNAGGIVVLTGGQDRINEGLKLLAGGKAERLLISGVYSRTNRRQLSALYPSNGNLFRCCVDLGWRARNTIGNADETRAWTENRRISSVIVVTSEAHMPRSLLEMRQVMPYITLVPYSVHTVEMKDWWMRRHSLKVVLSEYMKFLPSLGRCLTRQLAAGEDALGVRGACLNFGFKF